MDTIHPDKIITSRHPEEVSNYQKEMLTGMLEITVGLAFGMAEGVVVDILTGGISEFVPGTEFLADVTAVGVLRFLGIQIPSTYLKLGYVCSLIPVVKNFANPATLDGSRRILRAHKLHSQRQYFPVN